MARNAEKAQSMLYRFREAKAQELGLATRSDRRPRIASTCKDLRQCERWRGEILREVSRKVSKIQDHGLTDYEVRDLNDEINRLLREKFHWENQIIALGGANYKHAAPKMKDAQGREVPGIRGYKYFGRAKELPGVKELFESAIQEAKEGEPTVNRRFNMFKNVGPGYFGDLDENDDTLLTYEKSEEEQEWRDDFAELCEKYGLGENIEPPSLPESKWVELSYLLSATNTNTSKVSTNEEQEDGEKGQLNVENEESQEKSAKGTRSKGKRKGRDVDKQQSSEKKTEKRQKLDEDVNMEAEEVTNGGNGFRILTLLDVEELQPPKVATSEEMEKMILERQKKELLEEYT